MMVSGHLAYSVEGEKKDRIRPLPSWFMFIKGEEKEEETFKFSIPPIVDSRYERNPLRREGSKWTQWRD